MVLPVLVYWQFYRPSQYLPSRPGAALLALVPFEGALPSFTDLLVAGFSAHPQITLVSPGAVSRYLRLGVPVPWMARVPGVEVLLEGRLSDEKQGERARSNSSMSIVAGSFGRRILKLIVSLRLRQKSAATPQRFSQ